MKKFDLQLFASAVPGKRIVYLFRRLSKQAEEGNLEPGLCDRERSHPVCGRRLHRHQGWFHPHPPACLSRRSL